MTLEGTVVVVGGGGHVGLPLSIALAQSGFITHAYDISVTAVEKINDGVLPFIENGAEEALKDVISNGQLRATNDPQCIKNAKYIVLVIGTPIDEYLSPNPNTVISVLLDLKEFIDRDQTVILRSTLFPGVTSRIISALRGTFPGIKVAYCPERIIEGQALNEIKTLPQIIGANDDSSFAAASYLFGRIGIECIRAKPEEAELAKLVTNVWRYLKFATANQFWMMANDLGVDYEIVRKIISHNYPRAADLPRSGFTAGPCLFKDTMQLSALVQQRFPLGHAAMMINEGMPGYLVERLKMKFNLESMKIGILGMAFKGNVDDTRSSLAYKLRKLLMFEAAEVLISDPYVNDSRLVEQERLLAQCDLLIIGAPHDVYKDVKTNLPIIDIWGVLNRGVLV